MRMIPLAASAEMRLVMVEQPGCIYCRAWNDEVSAIYPLTRVQLREPLPDGMQFARSAR
jgi:thioredoxin-related protein